eukprot:scaffold6692_cov148-Skeletonema_dohrnii-CCMP3373.AAC.3
MIIVIVPTKTEDDGVVVVAAPVKCRNPEMTRECEYLLRIEPEPAGNQNKGKGEREDWRQVSASASAHWLHCFTGTGIGEER